MSLSDLLLNQQKPWLNARVNNFVSDGTSNLTNVNISGDANLTNLNVSGDTVVNNLTVDGTLNFNGNLNVASLTFPAPNNTPLTGYLTYRLDNTFFGPMLATNASLYLTKLNDNVWIYGETIVGQGNNTISTIQSLFPLPVGFRPKDIVSTPVFVQGFSAPSSGVTVGVCNIDTAGVMTFGYTAANISFPNGTLNGGIPYNGWSLYYKSS